MSKNEKLDILVISFTLNRIEQLRFENKNSEFLLTVQTTPIDRESPQPRKRCSCNRELWTLITPTIGQGNL